MGSSNRPEPGRAGENFDHCRTLAMGEEFPFVCAGCGDCCRRRRDLVLSGLDLLRLARWMCLPPRVVASAFCRSFVGEKSLLPTLCLTADPKTGNCRFFEGNACLLHSARPLACALYPLGQSIEQNGRMEFYVQEPLCGLQAENTQTLWKYLENAGVMQRMGTDGSWAVECMKLSERLHQAGGRQHPHFMAAIHRMERALYYDYSEREEFYPQFRENLKLLNGVLDKILN